MSTNTHLLVGQLTDLQTGRTVTAKDLIDGLNTEAGYSSIGSFIDTNIQAGLLDTPKNVLFGAGGNTDNNEATIGNDGVITVNTSGFYSVKQRFRAGRTGGSGTSDVFFWAEISVDNGLSWNLIGNSIDVALSNSNDTTVFFDISHLYFPAGVKLRNRFARSSDGNDSGDLRPAEPSAALAILGVPVAPSSQITVYKINTVP